MVWATTYGFVRFGQLPDRWSARHDDHCRQRPLAGAAGAGSLAAGIAHPHERGRDRPHTLMSKLGWILGDNVVFERASADGKDEGLAGLAGEPIRKRVEVILTYGQIAPVVTARATRTMRPCSLVWLGVRII